MNNIKKSIHHYNEKNKFDGEGELVIEYLNGDKEWFKNGERHRENGPAIEWKNGDKFWYKNNKLHREDGPAKEFVNIKN